MNIYGQPPQGLIVRGHYHDWSGISGSVFGYDDVSIPQLTFLDLSTVVCDYCGGTYLAEMIKSLKITNCLGCGSARFHFDRK